MSVRRPTTYVVALTALVTSAAFAPSDSAEAPGAVRAGWRLVSAESFSTPFSDRRVPWRRDAGGRLSRYHVDEYDDDGAYFEAIGGRAFRVQLATFGQYRKAVPFGSGGWLTAELAARDDNRDGRPDGVPSLSTVDLHANGALLLDEPNHRGGMVVRSTNPLPAEYRVEVTLRTIDFGGMRGATWDYTDGRVNGYRGVGCKTNHPWATSGDFSRTACDWQDVRHDSNGFYFLAITDYALPAPHNNVFIHTHRKVSIDGYNRYRYTGSGLVYCNPVTKTYEPYSSGTGNGVNAIFNTSGRRYSSQPGTQYVMESECGTRIGGAIVSQAELRPELMPAQSYRFAIERVEGGYAVEMAGRFRHMGAGILRYRRAFVQHGLPIWHYNQRHYQYDGKYDATWTYTGAGGTYTHSSTWPAGSAYPDHFLIGDPHTNFYEGRAHIDDIRLYVPERAP